MKIYWKRLIWNCIILPWAKLIYCRKSAYWKELNGIYWRMWNSKQMNAAAKAWASFLPKLDDVIRKVTTKDNAITTTVSTTVDQKIYKGGKVVAIRRAKNV